MIVWIPLALVGLFVLRGLGDFTETYFMGYVGRRIVTRLRSADLPARAAAADRLFRPQLIGRAAVAAHLQHRAGRTGHHRFGGRHDAREPHDARARWPYLLWLNLKLTLIALTMGPLVAWLVTIINKRFRRYSRRIQDSMGDVTRVAKEIFDAPRLIKVYNAQEHLGRQFETVNERNRALEHAPDPDKGPGKSHRAARHGDRRRLRDLDRHFGCGTWPDDDRRPARVPDRAGE